MTHNVCMHAYMYYSHCFIGGESVVWLLTQNDEDCYNFNFEISKNFDDYNGVYVNLVIIIKLLPVWKHTN